jgi:hypothetical protein
MMMWLLLALIMMAWPAYGQSVIGGIGVGTPAGSIGQVQFNSGRLFGAETVNIAIGCTGGGGTIGNALNGTISLFEGVTVLTVAPAIVTDYCGTLVQFNNTQPQTVSLTQAGTGGFVAGWFVDLCNIGAAEVAIIPTTGTIGGAASFVFSGSNPAHPICVRVISDGANYQLARLRKG